MVGQYWRLGSIGSEPRSSGYVVISVTMSRVVPVSVDSCEYYEIYGIEECYPECALDVD